MKYPLKYKFKLDHYSANTPTFVGVITSRYVHNNENYYDFRVEDTKGEYKGSLSYPERLIISCEKSYGVIPQNTWDIKFKY